jgi:hypothetical protein
MEYEAGEELNGDIFYYTIQDKKKAIVKDS